MVFCLSEKKFSITPAAPSPDWVPIAHTCSSTPESPIQTNELRFW